MLQLPRDIIGVILKKKNPARRFAHTCKRALEITKSLFSIEVDYDGVGIIHISGKFWKATLYPSNYVEPLYTFHPCTNATQTSPSRPCLASNLFEYRKEIGAAVLYCRNQSGVFVYPLTAAAKLEYFGQYLKLHGPLRGIYVGEPLVEIPRALRFSNDIYLVLE